MLAELLTASALAGDIVVHADLKPEAAVEQASADAGVPAEGLKPVTLPELFLGRSPLVVGEGEVTLCAVAPMAMTAVAEAAKRAESNVLYVDYTAALEDIDAATKALGCLRERANVEDAARLFFLAGVIASERKDTERAFAAFRQAHVFQPGLAWDEDFPPDAKPTFEEAARSAKNDPPMRMSIRPIPDDTGITVDGRVIGSAEAGFDLATGEHLVQLVGATITTVRVTVRPGEATLFVPNAVVEADAYDFAVPERAVVLSSLVATVAGKGTKTYVALPTGTWAGLAGDAGFQQIAAHDPAAARKRQKKVLQLAGGALALGGASLAGVSYAQGRGMIAEMEAPGATYAAYEDTVGPYAGARTRLMIGEGVLGAGAIVAGVGFALPLGGEPGEAR